MKQLRPYQQNAIDQIATLYGSGINRIMFQAATGSGKTITAAALIKRYIDMQKRKVLFVVHREELLKQFRQAIYEQYGLIAEPIVAGVKFRNPNSDVYVTMVETAYNRLRKNPRWFGDIGLLVIDEAHLGNHKKLFQYFEQSLIVGLSATPLSSSKRDPLKNYYQEIVCAIDIPELIEQGSLTQNLTYRVKGNVSQDQLKVKNGEFDNAQMAKVYSSSKHVENVVKAYEDHTPGTKAIVFNCNVAHSELVNAAFLRKGYPTRHLDGEDDPVNRRRTLEWFKDTPGAILQNINILTAGFDDPSIETVIMNRDTLSLPLWLQATGRGGRIYPGKKYFTIIDMGENALRHGDWSTPRDWSNLFHKPPKPGKKSEGSVAPIAFCVNCEVIIAARSRRCKYCGAEQPFDPPKYDKTDVEFELLQRNIDISALIQNNKSMGANPYRALHQAKGQIIMDAKAQAVQMDDQTAYNLLGLYQIKVEEWCRAQKKPYDQWHKEVTADWFFEELKNQFGWEKPAFELNIDLHELQI